MPVSCVSEGVEPAKTSKGKVLLLDAPLTPPEAEGTQHGEVGSSECSCPDKEPSPAEDNLHSSFEKPQSGSSLEACRGSISSKSRRGSLASKRSGLFDIQDSDSSLGSAIDKVSEGEGHQEYSRCGRVMLRRVVLSAAFDYVSGIAIILNAVLLGWAANYSVIAATKGHPPDQLPVFHEVATVFFTAWFSLELLLKMFVNGVWEFFMHKKDGSWNIFDTVVVGGDLIHSLLQLTRVEMVDGLGIENLTVARMLRILRIVRVVRVVRLIRFFRELRMMVLSVLRSGASLFWSCLLLAATIYVFGIYFCQVVAYHVYEEDVLAAGTLEAQNQEELLDMFGNVLRAEYILYQAISGGLNWGIIGRRLLEIHPFHVFCLAFYTFFTTFALLNIITGIFVQNAIKNAENDKDDLIQERIRQTESALKEMSKIFQSADRDASGALTLAEFEAHLGNPIVKAHLASIGIEVSKAKGVFRLLDLDMSGEITIEEFVDGCMRLKGNARSIDLAMVMYENVRLAAEVRSFTTWVEHQFAGLSAVEQGIDRKLSRLLGDEIHPAVQARLRGL